MNEQSRYGLPIGLLNAASNRVGLLLGLALLALLAACSTPVEVEVTREVEVEVAVETVREVEVTREVTVEVEIEVEVVKEVEVTREVEVIVEVAHDEDEETEPTPSATPLARTWHGSAWDTKRDRMIIAGGRLRGQSLPDGGIMHNIWAFDVATQSWEKLADFSNTLSDVEFDRVSYDSARDLLILHALGVEAETPVLTYHYDFETGEIVESSAEMPPVARFEHNFIYHPGSDRHIMYGGITWDIENTYGDTWSYDAEADSWKAIETSGDIPTRARAAFAYDPDRDLILTYGGHTGHLFGGNNLSDTWIYDVANSSWEEIVTDEVPMLDPQVTGAYDTQSQRFIIFGRNNEGVHETWALDLEAGTWTNMQPEGGPSVNHPGDAIYSPEMDRMLTFGGNINWPEVPTTSAELWAYDYDSNTWELIEPQ